MIGSGVVTVLTLIHACGFAYALGYVETPRTNPSAVVRELLLAAIWPIWLPSELLDR